jgi:hypothetical protein
LTPALDAGEWSASRPGRFAPKEKMVKTVEVSFSTN